MTLRTPLVSCDELEAHLTSWRVFDCRHDLMKPEWGEQQYREAHIPGALFSHLDRDLSAVKSGRNGRHPLPEPAAFVAWLRECGVQRDDAVVCYDAGNGSMAARLWWMLRWIGHQAAAVLDGGLARWQAEGRPVTREAPQFRPSSYPVPASTQGLVEADAVERERDRMLLLDARAPTRFRGEAEPIDPVAGHIPGARNRFNADNLRPDGRFKDRETLREEFLQLLDGRRPEEAVHYCGSGVSACHNLLAMEAAGLPGGRLYAGSWSEWIADPRRPVAR